MRSLNGGWHGLAGWGFRGFPETGAGLRADDGANSLSDAGPSVAAANLRLAELRPVPEFPGAEGFPLLLAGKARGTALRGHSRAFQADQAGRTARGRWRVQAALNAREPAGVGKAKRAHHLRPRASRWARKCLAHPTKREIVLAFSRVTHRENVDGQKEADFAGSGPHRRAEEIARAQDCEDRQQNNRA